jgi:hypothetical protein
MFKTNGFVKKSFLIDPETPRLNNGTASRKVIIHIVQIALGYGLDDQGSRVRFPAEAGNFSLRHRVQNGSGVHPASYPMGTGGSFPGSKASGA